jgi:hypothetical protein
MKNVENMLGEKALIIKQEANKLIEILFLGNRIENNNAR